MNDAQVAATVKQDLTWLQKHERLLIVVAVLAVLLCLGNKWLNVSSQRADQKAAAAEQQVAQQKDTNAKQAAQNAIEAAQYQQMVDTMARQNAALVSAVAARDAALQHQQNVDKTLPLPDLAIRWQGLAGLSPEDLRTVPSGINVSEAGARQTVTELEKAPVLETDLHDAQAISANRQAELDKANLLLSGLNTQVSGLNTQIKDQDNACKAEIASVKADARKSKRNWFVTGLVVGFLGKVLTGRLI